MQQNYVSVNKNKSIRKSVSTRKISSYKELTLSFISSLSDKTYGMKCDPVALFFKADFMRTRQILAQHLYYIFNELVFNNQLPSNMQIEWSGKLKSSSGITNSKYNVGSDGVKRRVAIITLSKYIITTPERLRDTLIHEMCHAAVWLLNKASDAHGPIWKLWALRARLVFPELPRVVRCHNYDIAYHYTYECTDCKYRIGRSRPSEKILRSVCGHCGGKFMLIESAP